MRLLIVEDEPALALRLQKALEAVDLCVAWRARQASGL